MEVSPSPAPPPAAAATGSWSDLPEDVALAVGSLLEAADVCALGCCSRSWRRVCAADCLWERLFRRRWPAVSAAPAARGGGGGGEGSSSVEGWKAVYIDHHRRMAGAVYSVIEFVDNCAQIGSLEGEQYLKAIKDLACMELGFIDVQFFLFSRKLSAVLNLIGVHYSIVSLLIPPREVLDALRSCGVTERQVWVSLVKLGRWFYGFRLPDENESHKVSLSELTMAKGEHVLAILDRGAVHEVFRVQVSSVATNK